MNPCSHIVIAEASPEDSRKFRPFFSDTDIDAEAWTEGDLKRKGIEALLREANIAQTIVFTPELRISIPDSVTTFSEYASYFVRELNQQVSSTFANALEADVILVLNLMPFRLSTTRVDKIVVDAFERESFGRKFAKIVVLLRTIDWFTQSKAFATARSSETLHTELCVADLRGYVAVSTPANPEFTTTIISRQPFQLLLRTDENTIYHSLIYGTNSYIGHFILRDSHVRTHYDLTAFIQRDNVWEFMFGELVATVGNTESLLIIGVGLEIKAISAAGTQLKAALSGRTCEFIDTVDIYSPTEVIPELWSESFDMALILTDIVNSGKTVEPYIQELQRTAKGRTVKIFSIAKMHNSPSRIADIQLRAGVEIKRKYYRRGDCILCDIRQPRIKVKKAADFRNVLPEQLTPYDFWEMIYETKALKRSDIDVRGRRMLYRIDTQQITRRYAGWLKNIISQRYGEQFPKSQPDAICTVKEDAGRAFAALVARALHVREVISIAKRDLDRTGPSGLPTDMASPFSSRCKVLVVDDGINKGDTVRQLVTFCRTADVELLGVMVLDSRLDTESTNVIKNLMGGRPLFAIYRWPSIGL